MIKKYLMTFQQMYVLKCSIKICQMNSLNLFMIYSHFLLQIGMVSDF